MTKTIGIFLLTLAVTFCGLSSLQALVTVHPLESPNGEHKIEIMIGPLDQTSCRIYHRGEMVLTCTNLGFSLDDGEVIPTAFADPEFAGAKLEKQEPFPPKRAQGIILPSEKPKEVRGTWQTLYGERGEIPDNYNELAVEYKGFMKIVFRAYDEGIAFCYEFETRENGSLKIKQELTSFVFPGDYPSWPVYSAQGVYENIPLSQVKKDCERPLLVQYPDGKAVAIAEARLVDFARMRLQPGSATKAERPVLQAQLAGPVEIKGTGQPYRSPWRVVMAADRPGRLLEHNYLFLNLNDPCKIKDTSWVKPGKVIREATLTTAGGKACVDFAVERGLQYVEYDAGWYGHEYDEKSDATAVSLDPRRNPNPDSLDLYEVIRYANTKGIGIIVYVNQKALARQLDEILPLYKEWGVKGIKFGFVHVGSQEWTTWLHEAIAKCAEYELMVDVHDEYRVTGWERTYPNLMTVEGIRGNEEMPTPQHNVTTALTRMLCGRGDYTPCWYTSRVQTSQSHQLALPIVMYSPWTFLYWYDRPAMFKGEPELELWKEIPTVWDETKVLVDDIPRTVAIARKCGETWYIGVLHGGEKSEIAISPTDVFGADDNGKNYSVRVYTDKSDDTKDRNVDIETFERQSNQAIRVPLRSNGGAVVVIKPL